MRWADTPRLLTTLMCTVPYDDKYNITWVRLVLLVLHLSVDVICMVITCVLPLYSGNLWTNKEKDVWGALEYTSIVGVSVKNVYWFFYSVRNVTALRTIKRNSDLMALKLEKSCRKYKPCWNWSYAALVLAVILSLIRAIELLVTYTSMLTIPLLCHMWLYLSNYVFTVTFVFQLIELFECAGILNCLCIRCESTQTLLQNFEFISSTCQTAFELSQKQILTVISCICVLGLHGAYSFIKFIERIDAGLISKVYVGFLGLYLCGVPFFCVIHIFTFVKAKERSFNEYVYWSMLEDKSGKLMSNDLLWFHLAARKENEFTPMGVFQLNNALIISVLQSATTYLVICLDYTQNTEEITKSKFYID